MTLSAPSEWSRGCARAGGLAIEARLREHGGYASGVVWTSSSVSTHPTTPPIGLVLNHVHHHGRVRRCSGNQPECAFPLIVQAFKLRPSGTRDGRLHRTIAGARREDPVAEPLGWSADICPKWPSDRCESTCERSRASPISADQAALARRQTIAKMRGTLEGGAEAHQLLRRHPELLSPRNAPPS